MSVGEKLFTGQELMHAGWEVVQSVTAGRKVRDFPDRPSTQRARLNVAVMEMARVLAEQQSAERLRRAYLRVNDMPQEVIDRTWDEPNA